MATKSLSWEQTVALGKGLGARLLKEKLTNNLICLFGDLGSGKTTFVKGLAEGLGVESRIQSPTFTYHRVHKGKTVTLYHFDCYRIETADPLLLHELMEALEMKNTIIVIEWAEKIRHALPEKRLDVYFRHIDSETREILFVPTMTTQEVQEIIEEFHVPSHVRRHCKTVADFAVMIGKKTDGSWCIIA